MPDREIAAGVVHSVPPDLREFLTADGDALSLWEGITALARNEWICWIEDAKKPETRRRPCCWPGCMHRPGKGL